MVDAPKFDTPLNAGESAEVRMELVRFSGEREEISNSVLITYKHTIADGPPPNKVPNMSKLRVTFHSSTFRISFHFIR